MIDNPLEKIQKINGIYCTSSFYNFKRMSVLAQDVEKVAPEVIPTDDNGKRGICYSSLIGLLMKGIINKQIRK